jgi:L-alanine-DL-glutamate epimerase-like enolase superfamily enzyme
MKRRVSVRRESWPSIIPFRISNHVWEEFACVVCEIEQDGVVGRGEALGVYYLGETPESMAAQLQNISAALTEGADRDHLLELLPPGGARFAADSALWDLESQLSDSNAWQVAGVEADPVETVFTIGLEDTPAEMAAKATAASDMSLFKVKLGNDRPVERIAAIRDARSDSRLIVDVNQGWSISELQIYGPALHELGVLMIEQPLPRGADAELENYDSTVPLCSDESCLHLGELDEAVGRYQMINIKLDKCGGLTHGLQLARAARDRGLGLMVGCMGGTSLAMAPSHIIAQLCEFVDVDGPLLITKDRDGGLIYERGIVSLPSLPFWGNASLRKK